MLRSNHLLVIDAGNTSLKICLFTNAIPGAIQRIEYADNDRLNAIIEKYKEVDKVMTSVLSKDRTNEYSLKFENCLVVDHDTLLPIQLNYKTPDSLGIDRICNAVAIAEMQKGEKAVSVDIGTCIKFDFVDEQGIYQGGSISPGISLRYKSLNDYTDNLPLIDLTKSSSLNGRSTTECIHSGVINGINAEINELINRYHQFGDLTFFVTGGDAQYFDIGGKNNIFVDENLTLKGLYQIYKFNAR
jgi:type III pantothenate kinase